MRCDDQGSPGASPCSQLSSTLCKQEEIPEKLWLANDKSGGEERSELVEESRHIPQGSEEPAQGICSESPARATLEKEFIIW